MATAELYFYDADDPNGATIFECSTDDEFVKGLKLDLQRDSLGSGTVTFARKVGVGLFTRQIVVPETLVRVLIPSIHSTKFVHGFFINPRQQQVVSKAEKGGEGFTFGGPGPKHYLERAILWWTSYTGIGGNVYPEMGVWVWPETARTGAILNRLLLEDSANPYGPFLPDLTNSFDGTNDSNGDPWDEDIATGDDDLRLKIQENYLKLLWMLEDISGSTSVIDLGTVSNPRMQLEVYQTFGRDLTGPLGADTVAWIEGVNIADDLNVEGSSYAKASHALVKGNEGVYRVAVKATWDPGELKKAVGTAFDATNINALELAGTRFLRRQDNGENQIDLRIVPGFDPENGLYMPGWTGSNGHFLPGDTISLTTGQGTPTELDYQNEDQAVTGVTLELLEAVRDDTDLAAARSFEVTVHLNEERKSSNSSSDLAGNRGTISAPAPILQLCKPGVIGEQPENTLQAAACSDDVTNYNSDYPPWSGDKEERLELTVSDDIPAGYTLMAVASNSRTHAFDLQIYDEQGNTWTLDAAHENTASSLDDYITVWTSVITNPLSSGDWVRWAANVGASISPTLESGRKCLGLYAYAGELSGATAGTGEGTFGGIADIDTPAGDVVVAALTTDLDASTPTDADWEAMIPYEAINANTDRTLLAQQLVPGGVTTWTSDWTGGSRDWAAIAVSYDFDPVATVNDPNDGHPDLVGTDKRVSRCGHRHDVHRDAEPTVDDDETLGYKLGTIWAVLDSLVTPTEIESVWVLADASAGAAVWLAWPGGSVTEITDLPTAETDADLVLHPDGAGGVEWGPDDSGGASGGYFSRRIIATATNTNATLDINSTSYLLFFVTAFLHDWDMFPATHFMITCGGVANAASQTVTMQLTPFSSATNPISAGGNDLVIPNTPFQNNSSGWIAVSDSMSGIVEMCISMKGSTSTVDLSVRYIDIAFKIDP